MDSSSDVPEDHFGHKNVIFLDTEEDAVPPRAIGAGGIAPLVMRLGCHGPCHWFLQPRSR